VTLEAQNAFGVNIPESSSIINVYSLPIADFSSDVSSGRPPLTVQFTDNSIGNPTAWFWDFGDGTTSNHENPIHTYIADGTYKVTLTVSNAVGTSTTGNGNYNGNGTSTSESSSLIYVSSTIIGPDFKSDVTTGTAPLSVQFHDNSNGNPTAWQWDFDSDGQVDSTAQNPVYEFKNSGNYNVALRVNNGNEWRNITKANYIIVGAGSSSASGGSSSGSSHTSGKASVMSASSSPEPPSNIEAKAFSQNYVLSKNHIKFEFTAGNIPVGVVEFDAKKTLGKITTTVEQLKRRSSLTPAEPAGKVIKYLNIWVGNSGTSSPENIENAKVGFRISKEEVTKKEESYIVLQRYADGNWNFLETTKTGEDSQYEYYQARTSGFSSFAITKMNKSEYNNTMGNFAYSARITPIKEMNTSTESKLNNSSEIKVESENTVLSGGKIIIIAILLMIIFLVGLIVKEKRKK
jgi:PGF-pre-PGF domain-containing protein